MACRNDVVDVAVVGGGPVGLFAAFYAGMRRMSVKILESLPELGGQLAALYPEKYIFDVAGFPKIKAGELVERLKDQALYFEPDVCLDEKVLELHREEADGTFRLVTSRSEHRARTVIIAAGAGAFDPRRLEVEGAERWEQAGKLHYFVPKVEHFLGKRVAVLGGGDSAVDWALTLQGVASEVHLVHRRTQFRAHEHSVDLLSQSKVNVIVPYNVVRVEGDASPVLVLAHAENKEELRLFSVDELVVSYGFVASLGPIKEWGLELEKNSIVVNRWMETNIPGVFAVGDVATYEGKVKLIAVGFGEAPIAVNRAKQYVDPKDRVPAHSSDLNLR